MSSKSSATAGSLRGTLPQSPAGAAGLYAAAQLRACHAHTLFTAAHVNTSDVARHVLGLPADDGQSPLALGRGTGFERQLTRGEPSRLQTAFAGIGIDASRFVDIAVQIPMPAAGHGRPRALQAREEATVDELAGDCPKVVWQGALTLTIGDTAFRVQPDLIVRGPDGALRVGEVKAWPDRGPRTSPSALASALGQVAVGAAALAQRGLTPAPEAVLVLALPRRRDPSARVQSIGRESALLDRATRDIPATVRETVDALPNGATLDQPETIRLLPTAYGDMCRGRCSLVEWCRRRAAEQGSAAVLGDAAAADLGTETLLGDPAGPSPRLRAALAAYDRAAAPGETSDV
jgi:hypothetical protein